MFISSNLNNLFIATFGGVADEAWAQAYSAHMASAVPAERQVGVFVRHFHNIIDGAMRALAENAPEAYNELARGHFRLEGARSLVVLQHVVALHTAEPSTELAAEITGMVLKQEALARMIRRILVPTQEPLLSYTMVSMLASGGSPLYDIPSHPVAVSGFLARVLHGRIGADMHGCQTMFVDPITFSNESVPFGGAGGDVAIDIIPAGMNYHEARAAQLGDIAPSYGAAFVAAVGLPVGLYGGGEGGAHPMALQAAPMAAAAAVAAPRTPERPRRACAGAGAGAGAGASAPSTPTNAPIGRGAAPGAPARPRRRGVAPAVHPAYAQQVLGMEVDDDTTLAHLLGIRTQLFAGAANEPQDITLVDAAVVVDHMPATTAGQDTAPEQQVDCALCTVEFPVGATVVRPGCCHNAVYCRGCACSAVRLRNTCPFCVKCMVCHQAGCNSYHHL
jgi:hypothetical protein